MGWIYIYFFFFFFFFTEFTELNQSIYLGFAYWVHAHAFFGEICHDMQNFEGILELQMVLSRVLLRERIHFSEHELLVASV